MAKNKIGLKFEGFEELAGKFEALEGSVKPAAENALKASKAAVTPEIDKAISKHKLTGGTARSLDRKVQVDWNGTTASVDIGFHIRDGGLPSVFLMYGTPRVKKDTALYRSVYGSKTKKLIAETQKEVFQKMIARRMG